jgi:hypothetical protein
MGVGLGFGEMFMIMLLLVAAFGATRLPGGDLFSKLLRGRELTRARYHAHGGRHWKAVDWVLLSATLVLGVAVAISYTR